MDNRIFFKRFNSSSIKNTNSNENKSKGKNRNQHRLLKQDFKENFFSTFKNISDSKKVCNSIFKRSISQNSIEVSDKSSSFLIKNQLLKNIKDFYLIEDKKSIKTSYTKISKNKKSQKRNFYNISNLSSPHILDRAKSSKTSKTNKNFEKNEHIKGNKTNKKLVLRVQSKNKDYIYHSEFKNDYDIFSPLSENPIFFSSFKKKDRYFLNSSSTNKNKKISNDSVKISSNRNLPVKIRISKSLKSQNINNNSYNFSISFNIANPKASKKHINSSTLISRISKDNNNKDSNFSNSFNNSILKNKNKKKILNDKVFDFTNPKNKENKLSSRLKNFNNKKLNTNIKANKKYNTIILADKLTHNNLLTILRTNKPNEMEMNDTSKIMNIIAMDEVNKQIKESLISVDKNVLKRELQELETNEICKVIEKLPVINNNSNINVLDNKNKKEKKIESQDIKIYKSKSVIYDEKYRILKHKKMVYDSLDDEEIEEVEISSIYISPDSFLVYLIDSIILICSFIELFYLPIYIAKKLHFCRNIFDFNEIMFYCIDIFYIIDLITEFFRAYYNFDEILIKKNKDICKKYLKSWFITDFIEAIPFYLILSILENKCDSNFNKSEYYTLHINKLYYIVLIFKIIKIFKVFAKNTALNKIKKIANEIDFLFQFETVLFTIFIFFSSLNIISCLFIFFGRNSYPGWIIECNIQNNSFIYIYTTAIYYIMTTVTTVGYGDITITSLIERIFQILILIVGTCAYSWIVTYISNSIQKIQEKSLDYEQKMSILKEIKISNPYLTENLYNKIFRYLQYNKSDQKNENEIIINCLPYPLKNILFMEMYKPIIKNFNIFKSFENSNFIVKVVTSFKPVLSVEGDILLQEGDFVEDIIFVKEGIISLEICVDLEHPHEYIEAYLNESGFGKSNYNIKSQKSNISNSLNTFKNTLSTNENNDLIDSNRSKLEYHKKYLKIIDIRKNEHFGDILMFLNERSPLRVKVKSKKAEIYLLNKTDAIEISTLYPNIWKRIMKKSLFNMKQIRNLARKILIIFAQRNGIVLNEDIYDLIDKTVCITTKLDKGNLELNKKNNKDDEYKFSEKNKRNPNGKRKLVKFLINDEKNENNEFLANSSNNKNEKDAKTLKNNLDNKNNSNISKCPKSSLKNNNSDSKKKTSLFKKSKTHKNKLSKESIKLFQSDKLKLTNNMIDIAIKNKEGNNLDNLVNHKKSNSLSLRNKNKSMPQENKWSCYFEKDDDSKSENTIKIKGIGININNQSDFDFLCPTPFKKEEINCEIYPNEAFNQNNFLETESQLSIQSPEQFKDKNKEKNFNDINNQIYIQNNKKIFEESPNNDSIDSIKNKKEKKINVRYISEINDKNLCSIIKQRNSKTNKCFDNLSITQICSTTINSSYENFNYFTKYQFSKDPDLRKKTFIFINEECLHFTNLNKTNIDPLVKNNLYINKKRKITNNSVIVTPKLKLRKSKKDNEFLSLLNKEEKISSSYTPNIKKRVSKSSKRDRYKLIHLNSSSPNFPKKKRNGSVIIRSSNTDFDIQFNKEKKHSEKKFLKKNSNKFGETELNFYGKMKTLRGSNAKSVIQNNIKTQKKKSYLDLISKNIFQNKQTLNNPEKFYTGLFTDLVQKRQIINKKSYITKNNKQKNLSKTRINEDNNSRNKNRFKNDHSLVVLSTNFENTSKLKRNSTTNEALISSNIELP